MRRRLPRRRLAPKHRKTPGALPGWRAFAVSSPVAMPATTRRARMAAAAGTAARGGLAGLNRHIAILVLGLYVVAKMFYLEKAGSAQPADIALVGLVPLTLASGYTVLMLRTQPVLVGLLAWMFGVNLVWSWQLNDTDFLRFVAYYAFDFLVCAVTFVAYLGDPERFTRWMPRFLYVSVVIQAGACLAGGAARATGTFSNPNQLAYYAVTIAALMLIVRRGRFLWHDGVFLALAAFCVLESVSRAGLVSFALILLLWLWFGLADMRLRIIGILAGVAALFGLASYTQGSQLAERFDSISAFEQRQADESTNSMIEERNLDRVVDYYVYTLLGAGEGQYGRFEAQKENALEVHSSFVTLLFSYGIVGLGGFVLLMLIVFRRVPIELSAYMVPLLVYGATHNGLRFAYFWIVLGLLLAHGQLRRSEGPLAGLFAARRSAPPRRPRAIEARDADFLRSIAARTGQD